VSCDLSYFAIRARCPWRWARLSGYSDGIHASEDTGAGAMASKKAAKISF
jgi:hypothetical protein